MPPGREFAEFGRLLVRAGYVVLCVEAYPYNLLEDPTGTAQKQGVRWRQRAAETLLAEDPEWTGMGKLTFDVRLAVDHLAGLECVDPRFLGIAGHSLGGKTAFCAGTLDDRISLIWASDFGMRREDSNWDALWYWGAENVKAFQERGLDHSFLLALHAPGTFILIAGETDGSQTQPLLDRAQMAYERFGKTDGILLLNHATGHQPTQETLEKAIQEIQRRFPVH